MPPLWRGAARFHFGSMGPTTRSDTFVLVLACTGQLINIYSHYQRGPFTENNLHAVVLFACWLALLAFIVLCPRVYWRNRSWALPVARVAAGGARVAVRGFSLYILSPLMRDPQPGLWGAAVDLARVLLCIHALAPSLFTLFMPLPPATTFAMNTVLTVLQVSGAGHCAAPLLRAPLTRARLGRLAVGMELLLVPAAAAMPNMGHVLLTERDLQDPGQEEAICRATVAFLHWAVAVVLPTMLIALVYQPPAAQQAPPAPTVDRTGGSDQGGQWSKIWQGSTRLVRAVGSAPAAVDSALVRMVRGHRPLVSGAACWIVLCQAWLLCRLSAGL